MLKLTEGDWGARAMLKFREGGWGELRVMFKWIEEGWGARAILKLREGGWGVRVMLKNFEGRGLRGESHLRVECRGLRLESHDKVGGREGGWGVRVSTRNGVGGGSKRGRESDHYFENVCSQKLNRSLTDIAVYICQIRRRFAGNFFLKRPNKYFFVSGPSH